MSIPENCLSIVKEQEEYRDFLGCCRSPGARNLSPSPCEAPLRMRRGDGRRTGVRFDRSGNGVTHYSQETDKTS